MKLYKVAIFDLDGVLVDTAKYQYLAWKETALELGFDFTLEQNELLKGVSRLASMEIIASLSGKQLTEHEKQRLAAEKNERYIKLINTVTPQELLPGALECLRTLKQHGIKIVLGSASKNAMPVLEQTGIVELFDAIIDGNSVSNAKPAPEVFLKGAHEVAIPVHECVVFEDSAAGIEAAKTGGMFVVGVGEPDVLGKADAVVKRLDTNEIYCLFYPVAN
jgi:beta-phosphoglucomutase